MIPKVTVKSVYFEHKPPPKNVSFDQKVTNTMLDIFENDDFWLWSLRDQKKIKAYSER